MYRNRSSATGEAIGALAFYGAIGYYAATWIAGRLHIGVFATFLVLIGSLASIIFAVVFVIRGVSRFNQWRSSRKRCVHGVRGAVNGSCESCNLERQKQSELQQLARTEQQRAAEVARPDRQRIAEIRERARALRSQEVKRLSEAWLSKATAYYSMTPRTFENAIAELFRKLGYDVQQTPYTNDCGKDAILRKDGGTYLVECKRYSHTNSIGRPDIQKFVAAMHDEEATEGYYVNTGRFTAEATQYAKGHSIVLYDRLTLPSLVAKAYPVEVTARTAQSMCSECGAIISIPVQDAQNTGICPLGHTVTSTITLSSLRVFRPGGDPACERCGHPMKIVNRYGRSFWGCTQHPRCRFTRKLSRSTRASTRDGG